MKKLGMVAPIAALAFIVATAAPASARTIVASAGRAMVGGDDWQFNSPNGVVYQTSSFNLTWGIPLIFDTSGSKTIIVRGREQTNGQMSCQAFAINTSGLIASQSPATGFPTTATYTSITLTLSSVPAGSVGIVACTMTSNTSLLGVDY